MRNLQRTSVESQQKIPLDSYIRGAIIAIGMANSGIQLVRKLALTRKSSAFVIPAPVTHLSPGPFLSTSDGGVMPGMGWSCKCAPPKPTAALFSMPVWPSHQNAWVRLAFLSGASKTLREAACDGLSGSYSDGRPRPNGNAIRPPAYLHTITRKSAKLQSPHESTPSRDLTRLMPIPHRRRSQVDRVQTLQKICRSEKEVQSIHLGHVARHVAKQVAGQVDKT